MIQLIFPKSGLTVTISRRQISYSGNSVTILLFLKAQKSVNFAFSLRHLTRFLDVIILWPAMHLFLTLWAQVVEETILAG